MCLIDETDDDGFSFKMTAADGIRGNCNSVSFKQCSKLRDKQTNGSKTKGHERKRIAYALRTVRITRLRALLMNDRAQLENGSRRTRQQTATWHIFSLFRWYVEWLLRLAHFSLLASLSFAGWTDAEIYVAPGIWTVLALLDRERQSIEHIASIVHKRVDDQIRSIRVTKIVLPSCRYAIGRFLSFVSRYLHGPLILPMCRFSKGGNVRASFSFAFDITQKKILSIYFSRQCIYAAQK